MRAKVSRTVLFEANLFRDPEVKLTPEGPRVYQYPVARNRCFKQEGVASEVSCFYMLLKFQSTASVGRGKQEDEIAESNTWEAVNPMEEVKA